MTPQQIIEELIKINFQKVMEEWDDGIEVYEKKQGEDNWIQVMVFTEQGGVAIVNSIDGASKPEEDFSEAEMETGMAKIKELVKVIFPC